MIGTARVKSCGQKDLSDDGFRSWDEQITVGLNRDYPDWKNPEETWMVPPVFPTKTGNHNEGEVTEKKVYDLLEEFGSIHNEPMFVVHSFKFRDKIEDWNRNLNQTEKHVTGEHDFVIIHRKHGIIFLQVKAASKTKPQFSSAIKQLEKDKQSLQFFAAQHVQGKLKGRLKGKLYSGAGYVVMPNCPRPKSVHTDNGIFKEDCESVEAFARWWDDNIVQEEPLDQELYNALVMRFVGMLHCSHCPIGSSIDKTHQVLVWKTKEQLNVLLNSTSEQWITGPAGSGKTWLLMEKVKCLAGRALLHESDEKILVVCHNLPLSKMLRKTFQDHLADLLQGDDLSSLVDVKTFSSLLYELTGKPCKSDQEKERNVASAVEKGIPQHVPKYDHIFVDECQDLVGDRWPMLFEKLWKDDDDDDDVSTSGADSKYKWFFYDTNQYLGFSKQQYEQHKKTLKKSTKLLQVLRNTGNIFDQSKKYFKSQVLSGDSIRLGHNECGLSIEWDMSLPNRQVAEDIGVKSVVSHVNKLRRNKLQDKDICVLVENAKIQERLSSELKRYNVDNQNAEECFDENQNKVVVETIRRFKGLEAKVIILYNPRFFVDKGWAVNKVKEMLYTAVSRCFCYLVVITTIHGSKALKSDDGVQEGTLKGSQQQRPTLMQNSQNLTSEKRSQVQALFKDQFGRRSVETEYESGPPEFSSKRPHEEEEERNDETEPAMVQVSAMEEIQYKRHYEKYMRMSQSKKLRPRRVNGSDLLEPGDQTRFQDKIRNGVFNLLCETVGQNLTYLPGSSAMDPSTLNVRNTVAQIEYSVYCERRNDRDTKAYTTALRNLKREITKSNEEKQCHEAVIKALRSLDISSTATVSMEQD